MSIDLSTLEGKETQEILRVLIDHITKTEEDIEEEKRDKKKKNTDLKVFEVKDNGFELGKTSERLEELEKEDALNKNGIDFINEHTFEETKLNEYVSYLKIGTPSYGREDEFILDNRDGYLRILTVERRKWTKKTVERLVEYLPELDRLYASPQDLEDLVNDLDKTDISGFTAKFSSYFSEKDITIQVHGGDENDLEKVKDDFNARPTRIEYSQRNSPAQAVSSAVNMNGMMTYSSVREGSEERGIRTVDEMSQGFETKDKVNFEVEESPKKIANNGGFTIEGSTQVRLKYKANGSDEEISSDLEEELLDSSQKYRYIEWDEETFLVFDRDRDESFNICIEDEDIVLYARENTSSGTLRDFCSKAIQESPTYEIRRKSKKLKA